MVVKKEEVVVVVREKEGRKGPTRRGVETFVFNKLNVWSKV